MKVNLLIISALALVLDCCNSNVEKKDVSEKEVNTEEIVSNEKINPEGMYTGFIPGENSQEIFTTLILKEDMSYLLSLKDLEKSAFSNSYSGKYTLDEKENIVGLQELDMYYKLEKNTVTMLGIDIPQSADYQLKKVDTSLVEKRWELLELNGKPIKWEGKSQKPFMILKIEDNIVNGSTGCNVLRCSYKIGDNNKITFLQGVATLKQCLKNAEVEEGFINILNKTDNYLIEDKYLVLRDLDSNPVAKFEVVYLN